MSEQNPIEVGPLWTEMGIRPRYAASVLNVREDVPNTFGVYAWYRRGRQEERAYVGKATGDKGRKKGLKQRLGNHLTTSTSTLSGSALRRNVAQNLGIATADEIKTKAYIPTAEETVAVNAWIRECQVAWIVCKTAADAIELEKRMKREYMPFLTKQ